MKKIILSLVCMLVAIAGYAEKTAKAVVSVDKKKKTFYYDEKEHSSEGTSFALNAGDERPGWYSYNASITTAVFDKSFKDARPTSTYEWFYHKELNVGYSYVNSTLKEIKDIENLNTSKVTNMSLMFSRCDKLTSLDLSSFNTDKVKDMWGMFSDCVNLQKIRASENFVTTKLEESDDMFKNSTSLVGGKGSTYSKSHTDASYAKIDGGEKNPGYFTRNADAKER